MCVIELLASSIPRAASKGLMILWGPPVPGTSRPERDGYSYVGPNRGLKLVTSYGEEVLSQVENKCGVLLEPLVISYTIKSDGVINALCMHTSNLHAPHASPHNPN